MTDEEIGKAQKNGYLNFKNGRFWEDIIRYLASTFEFLEFSEIWKSLKSTSPQTEQARPNVNCVEFKKAKTSASASTTRAL